ncbi:MAG: T9SS type A sorting domain-containing protein [Saprospiraceae bacterium]|nr:T9SS type A sorting domain-containing protein [Saprospiraceae bacterium]MCF8282134.1 T9SS type A sorting domain-containing protein [Bacteroidales bacterium]
MKKLIIALSLSFFAVQIGWSQFTVSGTITRENGDPVGGVVLTTDAGGGNYALTNSAGEYQFTLPAGSSGSIVPYNNMDTWNGVSTFDNVLISKHIDGSALFASPYQIIAADADNSGDVTAADTALIRSLIIAAITEFPNNTSWRFVDASYAFPNPSDPFQGVFPESASINNLSGNVSGLDFVAIKVGDVNNSAIPILQPDTSMLSKITGKVYFDQDQTCTETTGDTPLGTRTVVATGTGGTFYGNTLPNGQYRFFLPAGTYDVHIVQPNGLWGACEETVTGITVQFQGSATVDFAEQALFDCPLMEVNLGTWGLRRCFNNSYQVNYCNEGTAAAQDVYVEVTLDPYFENLSSIIPWTLVSGNTYRFEIGDVAVDECGLFTINFDVSCDAELGQTHCSYAHIYPDSSCLPAPPFWSGADLVVTGNCDGDNVIFTITNQGAAMTEPVPYVVIEDVMIQMSADDLLLGQGQSTTVTVPANGATWRLEAAEVAFHPYETFASATVEGCSDGSSPVTFGFVNLFPLADANPFEDLDCQENIGSFDPNDKVGLPLGVEAEHFIKQNQDLTYTIRFQNTGTDTAFNILIVDSLSASLNPATIRLLGSSHPARIELKGNGVAKFIFSNIMLPDSNVNEMASHGFVRFAIEQRADLLIGTQIENEAGIYFDFNDPIITNRTLHTVGKDFLMEVSASQTLLKGVELEVFPNPTEAVANFRFKGMDLQDGLLTVFDQQGRQVGVTAFTGSTCQFDGTGLVDGVYFFKIENAGNGVATGKILVK